MNYQHIIKSINQETALNFHGDAVTLTGKLNIIKKD